MNEQEFKDKTKRMAIRVIRLVESLPKNATTGVIGKQLLRSATSVGANYRSACRAKSSADMIAKLAIVEEEADESMYWIELLIELNLVHVGGKAFLVPTMDDGRWTVGLSSIVYRLSSPEPATDFRVAVLVTSARLVDLVSELNEVVAITVASIKTLRRRKQS
jgi:four helix bundle protein